MSSVVEQGNHGKPNSQEIPIDYLHESKHNPRRHFDGAAMIDLIASIQQIGIIAPLIVRPNQKGYEIAAGHRRYRAAKEAKLETVPCRILELTDQQFMEILTIENLQREDVHPLDEAKGYEALMAAPYKMRAEAIAQKVGKSEKYIYDSRKLLDLTKEAQQFFWDGLIDKGHAILLARLTPSEQAKVIGTKGQQYGDGGLLHPCRGLYDEEGGHDDSQLKACSVRELEDYIKRHIRFNAKQADQFLFPDTVAQVAEATQEKRKIIEITHEYIASDDVRSAGDSRVYGERAWKRADGQEDSKTCDRSVLGVIASGPGQGQAFKVCVNKERCLVHWGTEIRAREKRSKASGTAGSSSPADAKALRAEQAERARQEQEKAKRDHWEKMAPKIQAAVLEKIKTLPAISTGFLGDLLVKALTNYQGMKMTKVPRGKSAEDLVRHLGAMVLVEEVEEFDAYQQFPPMARAIGVDLSPFVKLDVQTSAQKKKGKGA